LADIGPINCALDSRGVKQVKSARLSHAAAAALLAQGLQLQQRLEVLAAPGSLLGGYQGVE